jgi:predicted DNA-binding transcriptional regulator AlpA
MSPHVRVLSFGELKRLKHIGWNEEYIAQLVGAGLFPAPIHPGAWRESHIDDWVRARKAKGDLSWMRFSLKGVRNKIGVVSRGFPCPPLSANGTFGGTSGHLKKRRGRAMCFARPLCGKFQCVGARTIPANQYYCLRGSCVKLAAANSLFQSVDDMARP